MRWALVFGLTVLVAGCGGGGEVAETNCAEPDLAAERARFASTVLLGTVNAWDGDVATFRIEEIWRGIDLPEEVEIRTAPGRAYVEGVRYLVFPTRGTPPLEDAPCTATTRWSEALAELRPNQVRTPGPAPATDPDLPWEWLIAAAVAVALFSGLRSLRNWQTRPRGEWDPDFTLGPGDD